MKPIADIVREEIKPMVDAMIAESLTDPDIACQSADFKRGWEQGMREGIGAAILLRLRTGK